MQLTAEDMVEASKGFWVSISPSLITDIDTDSREFVEGHAFLALRGTSFDGHAHASQIAAQASALIGDKKGVAQWGHLIETPQLQVADTLHALGDIAALYRRKLPATRVIAITGSYGKTTVRSMLAHVLGYLGLEVSATKENFNNLIGVPKTVMNIPSSADVAIVECGISEPGEMARLSEIVQPDIAIVTGLTYAHGEGLGDLKGVAREKVKLMGDLLPSGWCVLGLGVAKGFAEADCVVRQTVYDMEGDDAVSWRLDGHTLTLSCADETCLLSLSLPAKHWAENMALVAEVARKLAVELQRSWSLEYITEALQTWQAVDGRMYVYPMTATQCFTLIDDSYNANPASMQAAIDTLAALGGYRVAIVGDMLELGKQAEASHAALHFFDIDEIIMVGPLMKQCVERLPNQICRYFIDVSALVTWLEQQQAFPVANSMVLLKSSHGMGLYQIVERLRNRGQHAI